MSTYIGVTIGPIVKTLSSARKTGELWASSYIFSYIMKKLIQQLKGEYKFATPFVEDEKFFTEHFGVGIFHDRFVFEMKKGETFEELSIKLNSLIELILDKIAEDISESIKVDKTKIAKYLGEYFKIYYALIRIDDHDKQNPILKMMDTLDALELREKYVEVTEEDYLESYFANKNVKKSILTEDAFGIYGHNDKLPSLPYIAMVEHSERIEEEYEKLSKAERELEWDKLQEKNLRNVKMQLNREEIFRKPYNYAAIVQADADNMGEMIKKLWKAGKFKDFSRAMMEFSIEAKEIVNNSYKGFTLYAGGDDLLFFSPVIYKEKTVFHLVDELSEKFNERFEKFNEGMKEPFTYSFGVNIFYHKDPLYEALEQVRKLLFEKAKNYEDIKNNRKKNAIAFSFSKRSGQTIDAVLNKDSNAYKTFLELTEKYLKDEKFLKSLVMKLDYHKEVIKYVLHDENKVHGFFVNNFNEDIHKNKQIEAFIKMISEFLYNTALDEGIGKESNPNYKENVVRNIYAVLRFIKFLNEEGEKHE